MGPGEIFALVGAPGLMRGPRTVGFSTFETAVAAVGTPSED